MTPNKLAAIMLTWFGLQLIGFGLNGYILGGSSGMMNGLLQTALGFNISSVNGFQVMLLPLAFINFLSVVFFWNFPFLDGDMLIFRLLLIFVITIPGLYGLWQGLRGNL